MNWAERLLNNILAYVPQEQKSLLLKVIEDGEKTVNEKPSDCIIAIRTRQNQMPKVAVFGQNSRQVRIDMILATLFGVKIFSCYKNNLSFFL